MFAQRERLKKHSLGLAWVVQRLCFYSGNIINKSNNTNNPTWTQLRIPLSSTLCPTPKYSNGTVGSGRGGSYWVLATFLGVKCNEQWWRLHLRCTANTISCETAWRRSLWMSRQFGCIAMTDSCKKAEIHWAENDTHQLEVKNV